VNFVKNVSITLVVKFLILGLGFVFSVWLARHLGPQGQGCWALLIGIAGLGFQLGNFALDSANIYYSAKRPELLKNLASISLWFGLGIGAVIAGVIYLLVLWKPEILSGVSLNLLIIVLWAIPFALITVYFQGILLGLNNIWAYNLLEFLSQALPLLYLGLVFLVFKKGLPELLWARTLVIILLALLALWMVYKIQPFGFNLGSETFKLMMSYGLVFFLNNLLAFLVLRSDLLLVNYYLGADQTGIYSVAVVFGDLLLTLPYVVSLILYPKLSAKDSKDNAQFTCRVSRIMTFIMLVSCLGLGVLAGFLLKLVYGPAFIPAVLPLLYLLPGVFFMSLETILARYLAAENRIKLIPLFWGLAFLLNLLINVIIIPRLGVVGASISSSISYFLIFWLIWKYLQDYAKVSFKDGFIMNLNDLKLIKEHLFTGRESLMNWLNWLSAPGRKLASWYSLGKLEKAGVGTVLQGSHITIEGGKKGLGRGIVLGSGCVVYDYCILVSDDYSEKSGILIGDNCHFNYQCYLSGSGGLTIGSNCLFGPGVKIITGGHHYKDLEKPIILQGFTLDEVIIEDNVWIGAGAIILPKAVIRKGAIVAAGAVVNGEVPANSIVGGVPARLISQRGDKL